MSTVLNLENFISENSKYENNVLFSYKLYLDIINKNEFIDIEVIDGESYNVETYCLKGTLKNNGKIRVHIPMHVDQDLDLTWLRETSEKCQSKNEELYLAILNYDNIIYQWITSDLP